MPSPSPEAGMRRRDFIAALGGAVAMPVAVHAQQAMPLLGFISPLRVTCFRSIFPIFPKRAGRDGLCGRPECAD